jgi:hypothetical protein
MEFYNIMGKNGKDNSGGFHPLGNPGDFFLEAALQTEGLDFKSGWALLF